VPEQKIYAIGEEEIILMMGLLGIDGTILNKPEEFLNEFDRLKKDTSIGMIIIAMDLLDVDIQNLIEHKLSDKKPFVFFHPNIFKSKQ
jgi:vacuolar-type H+-ATPase subunit F/Vma7